jgi:hypothetical protein
MENNNVVKQLPMKEPEQPEINNNNETKQSNIQNVSYGQESYRQESYGNIVEEMKQSNAINKINEAYKTINDYSNINDLLDRKSTRLNSSHHG